MHYMVVFPLTSNGYEERVGRFLESGAPPPEGVTMHGRWFTLGHDLGFIHCETDDPSLIYRWTSEWGDLVDFEVHAVISDQQAGAVLTDLRS